MIRFAERIAGKLVQTTGVRRGKKRPHLVVAFLQHGRGGAEKQAVLVAEAVKESFDITLVVAKPVCAGWRKTVMDRGFRLVVLQKKESFLERRRRNSRLLELCFKLKPDLVYSRFLDFNIFLAKKRWEGDISCPIVVQEVITPSKMIQDTWITRLFYKGRILQYYRKADMILCNGSETKKDLTQNFQVSSEKCVFLPNMLALSDFNVDSGNECRSKKRRGLRIISVGRLVRQKDYQTLIGAVKRICKDTESRVDIFGEGPLRKSLQKQITRKGLEHAITLRGFVPNIKAFFPRFDVLVSCSRYEGMSNVVLEAMAAGLPVVATDVSGTRDIIEKPNQGIVFSAGAVEELANILESLAEGRDRLEALGIGGRERAKDFSIAEIGEKYLQVFVDML